MLFFYLKLSLFCEGILNWISSNANNCFELCFNQVGLGRKPRFFLMGGGDRIF